MSNKSPTATGARRKAAKVPTGKVVSSEWALSSFHETQVHLTHLTQGLLETQQRMIRELQKLRRAIEARTRLEGGGTVEVAEIGALLSKLGWAGNRAQAELDKVGSHLPGERIEGAQERWDSLVHDSESRRVAWTRDGSLVHTQDLADKWGQSRQALEQAVERGELFNIKVGNRRWYPAAFTRLTAEAVKKVNLALGAGEPVSKFVFWSRPHGGLSGRTSEVAIREGNIARVIELAQGWAEERGWAPRFDHAANA